MLKRQLLLALASALVICLPAQAQDWSLEEAAKPYAGTELEVVFLLRPGYEAAEQMLPEFEEKTGIKVNLSGGGATKGIRNAAKGTIHMFFVIC